MRVLKLFALLASLAVAAAAAAQADPGPRWGPETPNFNLEAILRPTAIGPEKGFGLVKFRQPNDALTTVHLDVWVRDLAPGTYYVQRAVDADVNGDCTGTNWTTPPPTGLGMIAVDASGTGRATLSNPLPPSLLGMERDIHFRIAETAEAASGVLQSACYQFVVSQ